MFIRINRDPDPTPPAGNPPPVKINNDLPPPAYTPPDIKMGEAIPPEFRDKPYFKDKGFVDVIKDHVNLQTLLGQRPAGIPKDDAPAEEWDKFLGAIKPKSVDEYGFPETEFSKAGKRNPGYEKRVREIAEKVGIPKRQFNQFINEIETDLFAAEKLGATQSEEQKKARELEFESMLDKTYAKDKQVVIDRTKKLMAESVDPTMKEQVAAVLQNISNENLFVLTAVLDGVYKKHIAEDRAPSGGGNAGGDAVGLQTEAEKIMRSPEYSDFRKPGHEAARQRVQDLFAQIAGLRK